MSKFTRLGNDLYSGKRSVDFVGRRHVWYAASGVIIIAAVLGLYFKGLNFGLEFRGGAQFTVTVAQSEATQANADKIRVAVADTGIDAAKQVVVTTAGQNNILVETEPLTPARATRSARPSRRRWGSPRPTSPSTRSGRAGARRSPNGRSSACACSSCWWCS